MLLLLSLLILPAPRGGDASPISCYNDKGEAVDWFYLYKLPKEHQREAAAPPAGQAYLLLEKGSEGWTEGKASVNDTEGALGRTAGQLYAQTTGSEVAYILYNDQRPEGAGGERSHGGHTKGFVLLDEKQGFWLVHSTPHFPAPRQAGHFFYPSTGVTNGQNFICVTYPLERFQAIGEQLLINQPTVYDCDVPDSLASVAPALASVCKRKPPPAPAPHCFPGVRPPSNRSVTLTSLGGTDFISFAKGASFHDDLYHSWVAPTLQSDLLVQFWVRSTGILPSDCSHGWKVLDITLLSPGQSFTFKTSQDHSKWAVSPQAAGAGPNGGGGWVCVGDINRNQAEEKRGGGTVCVREAAVWKAYRTAVLECQECGGETAKCAL